LGWIPTIKGKFTHGRVADKVIALRLRDPQMIGHRHDDGWNEMVQRDFLAGLTDVFARTHIRFAVPSSGNGHETVGWGFLIFTSMNAQELGGITNTKTAFLPCEAFDLSQELIHFFPPGTQHKWAGLPNDMFIERMVVDARTIGIVVRLWGSMATH
jgi:hypothetical protein